MTTRIIDRSYLDPYAGQWVAILDERVVAAGESLEEVLLRARRACPDREPEVFKVPRPDEGLLVV